MMQLPSFQNKFARNVFALATGTVIAQSIVLLTSPILTRLYTPSDFGAMAVFMSMLGFVGTISALRYELAIPLPKEDADATALTVLSMIIVLVFSFLAAAILFFTGATIVDFLNAQLILPFLWLLPVGLFLLGSYMVLNMWSVRNERFNDIAKTKLSQSILMVLVQLSSSSFGLISLISGKVIGQAAGSFRLGRIALRVEAQRLRKTSLSDLARVGRTYHRFPLISSWVGLFSSLGATLTPILLAIVFDLTTVGAFALAMTAMAAPMAILGKSIEDVFYRHAVEAHEAETLGDLIFTTHSRLVLLAMPIFLLGLLYIPGLFTFVFGVEWSQAESFAFWMLPWMFFQFTTTPCTGIFPILNRHWTALFLQALLALSPVLGVSIGVSMSLNPVNVIQILTVTNSVIYLMRLSIAYHSAGAPLFSGIKILLRNVPIAIFCGSPVLVSRLLFPDMNLLDLINLIALLVSLLLWGLSSKYFWNTKHR